MEMVVMVVVVMVMVVMGLGRAWGACEPGDRAALLGFKSAITEDLSGRLASWGKGECCTWVGVHCDTSTGRVVSLNLSAAASGDQSDEASRSIMSGLLSPSITGLDRLEALDLSNLQRISGELPTQALSSLVNLKTLLLNGNGLTGSLPSFATLTKLETLNLASNDFSGPIPSSIGQLTNLVFLDFSNNYKLTGPLPESLTNLSKLQSLDLLILSLYSPLPSKLSNMKSLTAIRVHYCPGIIGPIPSSLPPSLTTIEISHTAISGGIPPSLGSLAGLVELDLSYNQLGGQIPPSLGGLSKLTKLDLSGNAQLSGPVPESFGKLSLLQTLSINEASLVGPLPNSLGGMKSLTDLSLRQNRINGTIPDSMGSLTNLVNLVANYNKLSGYVPNSIARLRNLQSLALDNNNLKGLPLDLTSLNSLSMVFLDNNTGFSSDALSGLATLPSLSTLSLSGCKLGSPIPNWVSSFASGSLQTLDLSNNGLTGAIPPTLANLKLFSLCLAKNRLEGSIPFTLGNMGDLGILDLSENQLSGVIPVELSKLTGLFLFNVSNNRLSSKIPQVSPFTSFEISSYSDNPTLCGPPLRSC